MDWQPIVLVVVTAVCTGLVSLAVSWQQNIAAQKRGATERSQSMKDEHDAASRRHALELLDLLNELNALGQDSDQDIPAEDAQPLLKKARRNYLLINDADLRQQLAACLWLLAVAPGRGVSLADWKGAATNGIFLVAGYLRGESTPVAPPHQIETLRRKYPRSAG